ncbi:hypothetical protein AJ80_04183 [Polytolypa hystricis UAMH7299]|uniref:PHD finger and BAH domain-containing protein n=1 Tax=Polytolypa hystricis (strain UAMH7299) TaxID=1447883 RepID=A0A2B7YEA3_POLH7|nr:hypothetical protein AJ80_04183 [Polytolypa hystricis UAMH7299]
MSSSQAIAAAADGNHPTPGKTSENSPLASTQNTPSQDKAIASITLKGVASANGTPSQSMTATTTSSSTSSPVPAAQTSTASPAVPPVYGTRSRNRGGAPRPNYAEDPDIDGDLELVSTSTRGGASKKASPHANTATASPSAENDKASGVSTRRSQTNTNNSNTPGSTKDAIPGTSSFSANPNGAGTTTASKKRKQPGSSNTVASSSTTTHSSTSTKKFVAPANLPPGSQGANGRSMMTFINCRGYLKNGKLKADDGTTLSANDHVYLVCEPPGEPYYLARIMEFLPSKNNPTGPIESIRVNWYYRSRDLHRKTVDMRVVFASMHSDTCPLTSLRGKCQILHQSEVKDMDEFRKSRDCFWFDKMYDRYIQRYYDVIPTSLIINVPEHVKKVLRERWRYVLVEVGRRKELLSDVKTCKKCCLYAANVDSVDCAVCHSTYHMDCVRPKLLKKPARGFAWACAPCSRAQERKLEARNTPIVGEIPPEAESEIVEEEEEDPTAAADVTRRSTPAANEHVPKPATAEQIAQAKLWPFRYLGIHCRVEDALDYDDRIYPRASSRLGTRHQANVLPWYGHPVRYVKAPSTKKKYLKSGSKKDLKLSKETLAAIEAERAERAQRPKWVMDEPTGYISRGKDEPVTVGAKQIRTLEPQFIMPDASQLPVRGEDDAPGASLTDADREKFIDDYMTQAKEVATSKGIEKYSTNFLDKALKILYDESFNVETALAKLKQVNRYADLKEPHLRADEVKLFESGVAKYGSELRLITKHVGTVPHRHIVRYYYMWKKTPKGRQIWGNFEGRRGKKAAKKTDNMAKLVDDVADDHDDSAFDAEKAIEKKRGFTCKFCSTRSSRQWRRAPATAPGTTVPAESSSKRDKGAALSVALCQRCAVLWRKYGLQWEDVDEVAKKVAQGGHKSSRRRYEEELLIQLLMSSESEIRLSNATATTATAIGIPVTAEATPQPPPEPPKKKAKASDRDSSAATSQAPVEPPPKKKVVEKPPEPPALVPEPPRAKTLPCAVCNKMEPMGDQHLSCRDCRLTVHRGCYGVSPSRSFTKWYCDMCANDRNPMISTNYECILCPVTWTEHELMEPPKITHKKKTDREREKERLEKEMVTEAIKLYRQRQEAVGKPIGPREPLKRTAGNNWVHVTCAIWNPEIKFGNAKELEPAEGFGLVPQDRFQATCKICKTKKGACVSCQNPSCNAKFHVECAHQNGYIFGFDVTPVKSSRRDTVNTMKLGEEAGAVTPGIWCFNHDVTTVVHEMSEPSEVEGLNALQLYAQTTKQADLTLTGTVRKAAHVQQSVGASIQNGLVPTNRRISLINGSTSQQQKDNSPRGSLSPKTDGTKALPDADDRGTSTLEGSGNKKCSRCQSSCSPKWWRIESSVEGPATGGAGHKLINGVGSKEPGDPSGPPLHTPPLRAANPATIATNGDVPMTDIDRSTSLGRDSAKSQPSPRVTYECHKCHFRKQSASLPVSDVRPSPSSVPRDPSLPAPRAPEFAPRPFVASPHGHPPQLPMPPIVPVHSHGPSDWRPEYDQRPAEYGAPLMRPSLSSGGHPPNGIPLVPPSFHPGPPPPSHMNGYHPSIQPAYPNGAPPPPPPHSYPAHHSPYAPVSLPLPGGHPPPPPPPARPYSTAGSPPVHFSTPSTMSGMPPGPPRMYSVERSMAPNLASPSSTHRSLEPQRPSTPATTEGHGGRQLGGVGPPGTGPNNSERYSGANGTGPGASAASGASASPSLKNLLS